MRIGVLSTLTLLVTFGTMTCAGDRIQLDPPNTASGGRSGSAGRTASAGTAARGGTSSAGRAASSGGTIGSSGNSSASSGGRTTSSGGATTVSSGGNTGSKGGTMSSAGGATNTGGKATSGGTANSGGSAVSGGATNTGGGPVSGGASNTGASNTGGSKATGGTSVGGGNATGGINTGGGKATGGTSTGGNATGGSNVVQPPPITGGSSGWASRYWDCCKPACGWTANVSSGNPITSCDVNNQSLGSDYSAASACPSGGQAYMCYGYAPWAVSDTLAYGFVAAPSSSYTCGRCYQLQFTGTGHDGNNAGVQSLSGKTMIVQVTNSGSDVDAGQFDLLVPGGGVGANPGACQTQWGTTDLGSTYGGFLTTCNGDAACTRTRCQTVFADKPDLLAGCEWFLTWYGAADNPNILFKQIACPAAITSKSGMSG
jgi:hypothetical protein